MAPPFASWASGFQALGSKSPDIGRKMARNLSVTISNSDLCYSQIFRSFWPPHFRNPAYATVADLLAYIQGVHKVRVHFRKFSTLFVLVIERICKQDLKVSCT